MKLYPLSFEPHYIPKLWGGRQLQSALGKSLPRGEKIGESWEIYDRGENSALVSDGPLKGQTLGNLVKEFGPRLLGNRIYAVSPDRFPLLIKFIDASDWLSVQVHPDDDYVALHIDPDESGKTEMWYLLDAQEGSEMIAGLKKGVDRLKLRKAIKEKKIDTVLNRFKVHSGEAIFLPAGRVHAIGPGCLLAEIQQNSDTTYRLHDFGRLEKGEPRPLHLSEAMESIDFGEAMQALPNVCTFTRCAGEGWENLELTSCEYFRVSLLDIRGKFRDFKAQEGFHVLMALEDNGTLEAVGCDPQALVPGHSLLIPASLDWSIQGPCKILWVRPGI